MVVFVVFGVTRISFAFVTLFSTFGSWLAKVRTANKVGSSGLFRFSHGSGACFLGSLALCAVSMQVGPGQGGKGVASSPNRMEQGFVMPATCGAYDESLYRSGQQSMPVPPSTPK